MFHTGKENLSMCVYTCACVCACVAAKLKKCERDQYEGVYCCHATVRPRVCVSKLVFASACVRESWCVPAALVAARSIRQMITISTSLPPQAPFGRSVSFNKPPLLLTHSSRSKCKMRYYTLMSGGIICALYRQRFWDSEVKLVCYGFYLE